MAAIHQDCELDGPWPTKVIERVEGGTHGPSRIQHVVDEHHDPAIDPFRGDLCAAECPGWVQPQVVAVHGDV